MPLLSPLSITDKLLRLYVGAHGNDASRRERRDGEPALLVCWPYARMNRYQDLLYSAADECGFSVLPITRLDQLADVSWPGPVVFHAHWFASLHKDLRTEEEALAANAAAFAQLEDFRRRTGAKLLWTAHNMFPHNTVFPRASMDLRRRTMVMFDMVHYLSEEHRPLLATVYRVGPRYGFVAPHMTYEGVYPNYVTVAKARSSLGITGNPHVFAFFGSIQPYKGLDTLIAGFKALVASGRTEAVLLIAGRPVDANAAKSVVDLASDERRIVIDARQIPDDEVQLFFKAADTMVFPYGDTLNSGAAALAVTFGRPMIVPETHAFGSVAKYGTRFYEPGSLEKLTAVMARDYDERDVARTADTEGAVELRPINISRRFFRGVEDGL